MAAKIVRNDEVVILVGKDKGRRGKVKNILNNKKVIIENLNLIKKHQKPIPNLNKSGGIIKKEAAIEISNIAIFNPETGKADRVGFRFQNGKKIRFFKSNKKIII